MHLQGSEKGGGGVRKPGVLYHQGVLYLPAACSGGRYWSIPIASWARGHEEREIAKLRENTDNWIYENKLVCEGI